MSMTKNNIGPRTRNQALAIISVAMQGAVDAGLIDANPAVGVNKAAEGSNPSPATIPLRAFPVSVNFMNGYPEPSIFYLAKVRSFYGVNLASWCYRAF